jgi:hypothetical protein
MTKRSATDDLRYGQELDKRAKSSNIPPTPDLSPVQYDHPQSTPSTIDQKQSLAQSRAKGFLSLPPRPAFIPPANSAISTPSPLSRSLVARPTRIIPPIPLDAVAILQGAPADMLRVPPDKESSDREKHLMAAVGTMRACLDTHFAPHMGTRIKGMGKVNTTSSAAPLAQGNLQTTSTMSISQPSC